MAMDDVERFQAFCKQEARALRHVAAALGRPVEYEYLRQYPAILERYKEVVPGWTAFNMHSVEMACYDASVILDLAEINRIRAEADYPPLDFIPEVQNRMQFEPPCPRTPQPPDEQEALFHKWAEQRIHAAYHAAAARGIGVLEALFMCPWVDVASIQRNFPGLNPAWCLQQMFFSHTLLRPKALDPGRVAALKAWSDTVSEVGTEIAKLADAATKPKDLMQ